MRISILKRILSLVLVVFIMGISFSSCAGQFAAFNKVQRLISNIGGKYIGGIVFWILGGPVLPVCLALDLFLFNVIEFWFGRNIIASGNTFEQIDENGNRLTAVKNDDGTLSLKVTEVSGETAEYLLERNGNDFSMFDSEGVLLSSYSIPYEEIAN